MRSPLFLDSLAPGAATGRSGPAVVGGRACDTSVQAVIIVIMEAQVRPPSSLEDPRLQAGFVPGDPDLIGSVRRRAHALWDVPPDFLMVAPGRIEIVGNHIDYNGGDVVAAAVDRWVALAARRRDDGMLRASVSDVGAGIAEFPIASAMSFDHRANDVVRAWSDYAQASVAAVCNAGLQCSGIDLYYRGTIPLGSGLSASSALFVAAVAAIIRSSGATLDRLEIARIALEAEHRSGSPVGPLDQVAIAVGGILRFANDAHRIRLLSPQLGDAVFVLCDSGVRHGIPGARYSIRVEESRRALSILQRAGLRISALAEIDADDLERALALLPSPLDQRVQHVVEEVARTREAEAAIESGDLPLLGHLMSASGRSSATLYDISHPVVERVVAAARETPGVYGARMMGGGDGGAALALVERSAFPALQQNLSGVPLSLCRVARGLSLVD
jgi:galactokinase